MTEEDAAELATEAVVTVATVGLFVAGAVLVNMFTQTTRIWGEHAAPGAPARPTLRRGLKVFLGCWGLACLMAIIGLAPFGAILGVVATIGFVGFVSMIGARYQGQVVIPEHATDLDSYLVPFVDEEPDVETVTPAAYAGTVPLRVIRTYPPPNGNGSKTPQPHRQ
jgi:amino acid transporter